MPMYNHYIPQSDGSYRRSTVPEGNRRGNPHRPPQNEPAPPPKPQPEPPKKETPKQEAPSSREVHPEPCHSSGEGILSFLRGLLPRDIDTADLLVILLILLMNREEKEDPFSPMLTLALYFLL